jgi:hypothetical protein
MTVIHSGSHGSFKQDFGMFSLGEVSKAERYFHWFHTAPRSMRITELSYHINQRFNAKERCVNSDQPDRLSALLRFTEW